MKLRRMDLVKEELKESVDSQGAKVSEAGLVGCWSLVLAFVPNLLMAAHKGTALLSPQTHPSMSDYGPKSLPGN